MKPLIAILTYNRKKILQEMLESLKWCREKIVIFDDLSNDGTRDWLDDQDRYGRYFGTKRGGVSINSNRAIKHFKERKMYDVLFLLNDDLLLHRGCFDVYLEAIEKTGYDHFCYTDQRSSFRPSELFEVNGISLIRRITGDGAFMTITRDMVETLGGFDPEYGLAGGEHYDYSRRAAATGFCKDNLDVVSARDLVVVRQYGELSLPRSLVLKELIDAKEQGARKWVEDMNEEPVIWKEIVT